MSGAARPTARTGGEAELDQVARIWLRPRRPGTARQAVAFGLAVLQAAELYVYADNVGAIALYEVLGWEPAPGADVPHARTDKQQRRYRLDLAEPGDRTAAMRCSS